MTLPQAIAEVTEAYLHLHGKMQKKRLIHAVQGAPDLVSAWIPIYLERMGSRGVQQSTVAIARRYLLKAVVAFGHLSISEVTTRHIADYLATLAKTPRTQQATPHNAFFTHAVATRSECC